MYIDIDISRYQYIDPKYRNMGDIPSIFMSIDHHLLPKFHVREAKLLKIGQNWTKNGEIWVYTPWKISMGHGYMDIDEYRCYRWIS